VSIYTFSAHLLEIPRDSDDLVYREAKGAFRADKTFLLNTEGKSIVDYLLTKVEITRNNIEFNVANEASE
jgi:hypothetical protein